MGRYLTYVLKPSNLCFILMCASLLVSKHTLALERIARIAIVSIVCKLSQAGPLADRRCKQANLDRQDAFRSPAKSPHTLRGFGLGVFKDLRLKIVLYIYILRLIFC